jgi:hypothetical protein
MLKGMSEGFAYGRLGRAARSVHVCLGKVGWSGYTIVRTTLKAGRQELASDSV